jgi:hypothetical protein
MDISPSSISPQAQLKVDQLKSKLNQQLEVKIITSKPPVLEAKTIPSNQTILLEANQPYQLKPEQTLQLVVSKTTPPIEFKLLDPSIENKNLIFTEINTKKNSIRQTQPESAISYTEQNISQY